MKIKNLKIVEYAFSLAVILNLLFYPILASADLQSDLQNEINQKQTQIKELEKQIAQYNTMVKNAQSQSATLKNAIAGMTAQIRKLEAQIRLTQTKISEVSLQIEGLGNDISTQNLELEKQKNNLGQTIRALNEYDQVGPIEILLANGNFSDMLNQAQYISDLQKGLQERLTAIKNLKAQLEDQKNQNEQYKNSLQNLKIQLGGQTQVLDFQKDDQQNLLTATKNQEKQYQAMVGKLQAEREQIEREIFLAEEKLRQAINPDSLPTARKGVIAWPFKGALTQTYGCIVNSFARKSYPACNEGKGNGGFHNGLDIDGETGDPVHAALEGTVVGTANLGKYAYGKWIAIKHENGLTTLYGHLSAPSVSVGQKVKTGEVIGYMGSTGYSTGSHLHFTVYASNTFQIQQKWYGPVPLGGPLNPLLYL